MTDAKRGRQHAHIPHDERRRSVRRPASMVPNLKARLLAGPDVRLVDISRRGILLETDSRLMPGSPIRIKLVADDANVVMKGCVVLFSVAVVTGEGIVYRTGIPSMKTSRSATPRCGSRTPPRTRTGCGPRGACCRSPTRRPPAQPPRSPPSSPPAVRTFAPCSPQTTGSQGPPSHEAALPHCAPQRRRPRATRARQERPGPVRIEACASVRDVGQALSTAPPTPS